jgi:hypothetical protein
LIIAVTYVSFWKGDDDASGRQSPQEAGSIMMSENGEYSPDIGITLAPWNLIQTLAFSL